MDGRPAATARLSRYLWVIQAVWLAVVLASCLHDIAARRDEMIRHLAAEARTACDKDLLYRRWVAGRGGVYAEVDETTPPNPYLRVPERDISTPSGRRLTLINPAYMTRQVHELERRGNNGIRSHITSLRPLNPANAPDPWERRALEEIDRGAAEFSELVAAGGTTRFRYMRRLLTEKPCLRCHAAQGYREGDVRGAIGVSIDMTPWLLELGRANADTGATYFGIWLFGAVVVFLGGRRLARGIREHDEFVSRVAREWDAAMDASDDAIYLLDLDRRIIRANAAFAGITGVPKEELVGRHVAEVVHPGGEDPPCEVCAAQEERRDLSLLMEADHPNNPTPWPIEVSLKVIRDRDGRPMSMLMVLHSLEKARREMEEKKRLEAELLQARKMEAIGTLAGGIAHDFNNILTAIIGYTEMAALDLGRGGRPEKDLDEVLRAAGRARDLVRQILTFSRHSGNEPRPLLVQYEIKEALKLLRATIPTTIALESRISADCPPVMADPAEIHQIVMNLVTNAYQATRDRGGRIEVALDTVEVGGGYLEGPGGPKPGPCVRMEVRDTGEGIDPEHLDRIFEPYFTTKPPGEGTGLGLAVVQGIVHRCNGWVGVESEPGKGTCFTVLLPACEGCGESGTVKEETPAGEERGRGETVLVVDDDPTLAGLEGKMLESLGYRARVFSDSAAALEEFRRTPRDFDLVLSDMTMPGMSGTELAREIRKTRADVPVIIATGYSELAGSGMELGVTAVVSKPVSREDLAAALAEALAGREQT